MIRFINRDYEMSLLKESWKKNVANFIVIYGRRRVGKTRIALEFMKNKEGISYTAEDTNKKVQINGLKNKIAEYFNDEFLRKTELNEWRDLFEYLKKVIPRKKRMYFIIDEFSYIVKNDESILSILQKFWDGFLSKTNVFFMISGSMFGLMSEKVLSSASPLYGRRSRDMLIRPLVFEHSSKFLKMPFDEKLKVYMCIGGVPEYLLKARGYKDGNNFLINEFLKKDGYFYREPYFLLSQEFKEIKTYFTILNAIAYGKTKPNEIANFAGIKAREIYPYFENLIRLGFVERICSILGSKKVGIYLIKDVLLDAWFNLVLVNREKIEREEIEINKNELNTYFGKRFEMFVRNELFHKLLKFKETGKWWGHYRDKEGKRKEIEIDIVALNEQKKEILFAECKWKENVNAEKVLSELKEKSGFVQWNTEKRKDHYAIFAKSFKKKIKEKNVHLFDLKDIEKVFR